MPGQGNSASAVPPAVPPGGPPMDNQENDTYYYAKNTTQQKKSGNVEKIVLAVVIVIALLVIALLMAMPSISGLIYGINSKDNSNFEKYTSVMTSICAGVLTVIACYWVLTKGKNHYDGI